MCQAGSAVEDNPHLSSEAAGTRTGGSRRGQQRAQRELRVQYGTRDLVRGLESLASGPNLHHALRHPAPIALGPQDRVALEGQVRELHRNLRQGAAGGSPPQGWEALGRLSRESPGYGVGAPGPPRGALVRAEVDKIDLPSTAGRFEVRQAEARLEEWRTWMLRSPEELEEVDRSSIRAHADPALRGRMAKVGDALEVLAVRMVKAGLVVPTRRTKGVHGVRLMTVAKSKGAQRLVWDMRQANARFRPPPKARLG